MPRQDTALEALRVLHELETTQGSKAKKELLASCHHMSDLRDMCFAAYGGDKYNAYPTAQFADVSEFQETEDAQTNWVYFKSILIQLRDRTVTGDAAKGYLDHFLSGCNDTEKKWYRRLLEHDFKLGLDSSFGKVWDFKTLSLEGTGRPDTEVAFPGVMLCEKNPKLVKKWEVDDLLVEPKLDGMRLLFVLEESGRWSFFSRQGKNARYNDNLKHVADDLLEALRVLGYTSGYVDGEIMGTTWNSTLAVKRKEITPQDLIEIQQCKFHVFDVIESSTDTATQLDRRQRVVALCDFARGHNPDTKVTANPQFRVQTLEEADALCRRFLTEGYEGAVVKSPKALYQTGNKRSREWIKLKPIDTLDVRVTGFYGGKERTRNEGTLGGFNVIDSMNQEFNVGGGFTDVQRAEFWSKRDQYIGRFMEIEYQPDPKQVAKGRFPVFVRWREDLND